MPDDFSVLRLDIDGEAMRALLAVLGVPPSTVEGVEREEPDTGDEARSAPSRERAGPRTGETPPPGAGDAVAPDEEAPGDEGRNTLLLAALGTALLGVVAAAGYLLYRRRSNGTGISERVPGTDDVPVPDIADPTGLLGDDEGEPEPEPRATTDGGRPVDAAPLIGMGALALAGAAVRRVRSDE